MSKPKNFLYAIKYLYVNKNTGIIQAPTRHTHYKLNHWYSIGDIVPTLCVAGYHFPTKHNILSHDQLEENWYADYKGCCNHSQYEMKTFLVKVSGIFDISDTKICAQEILIVKDTGITNKKNLEKYVRELIANNPGKTAYDVDSKISHHEYARLYKNLEQFTLPKNSPRFRIK